MVRIAIPIFHKRVSPVLDACIRLSVIDIEKKTVIERQEVFLDNLSLSERVNLIKKLNIDVIICCAVSEVLNHMLTSTDIRIICGIMGDVDQILDAFLYDQLDNPDFHMPGYKAKG